MYSNVNIKTDKRLLTFADRVKFPGWYFDVTGNYCCVINSHLISIFINDCNDVMEIAVDTIGDEGLFDCNVEWETPENDTKMVETACKFMKKYGVK